MKAPSLRALASVSLGMLAVLVMLGAATPTSAPPPSKKFVLVSTSDVKGKTSPCG
jgi:hypothetical protein